MPNSNCATCPHTSGRRLDRARCLRCSSRTCACSASCRSRRRDSVCQASFRSSGSMVVVPY